VSVCTFKRIDRFELMPVDHPARQAPSGQPEVAANAGYKPDRQNQTTGAQKFS
jgi:hypothetical protein